MKKLSGIFFVIFALGITGCASMERNKYYADLAKEHEFEYYFPSSNFNRTFSTIEEAYDFVKTAQAKFSQSVNKPLVKGLAAKLIGPSVEQDVPVSLGCLIHANSGTDIELSNIDRPMESVLRDATSASIIFLVFYQNRGVSIPSYYLKEGYVYVLGNAQVPSFTYFGNNYKAEYPVGWGTEKGFSYLKKEID
jgi:hypothetical protein